MKVRKIVAGLAAVSMLAAFSAQAVFAADTVTIKAGEATAAPGEEFTLDVSLAGVPAQGISVMEFAVKYDPSVVAIKGVSAGKVAQNGDAEKFDGVTVFEARYETEGLVTITYSTGQSDAQYCITESGVFATISGTVAADAKNGEYPVTITAIPRETVEGKGDTNTEVKAGYIKTDGTVTKYGTTLTDGKVIVKAGGPEPKPTGDDTTGNVDPSNIKYGDVNCDNEVDILDVIALNKNLLGAQELSAQGRINADVDANKDIDSTDSLNILKCVVKLIAQADFPIK